VDFLTARWSILRHNDEIVAVNVAVKEEAYMNISSKKLLNSGHRMPVLGLGTWQLTESTAKVISRAIKTGYPMIDTSGDYGTQPGVGQGIKDSKVARQDIYIVTKVEETGDAYDGANENLKQLQLDYVDLLLIHRPPSSGAGQNLWAGLIQARDEGMTKDIGVSNYSEDQIQELIDASGEVPAVNQIEWTPFGHSQDMFDYCRENHIVIQAYSPLARREREDDDTLRQLADKYHKSPSQIMIRWNLQRGTVPLPKANNYLHLRENIDVFDFDISEEDIATLNALNEEYSALGALPYV
jgi:diketogulonate reductase-like aldo/keto reductase